MNIIDEREITSVSKIHKGDTFIYENDLYICFKQELNGGGVPNNSIIHCVKLRNGEMNKIWGGAVERVDVECHIVGNKYQPILNSKELKNDAKGE